MHARYHLVAIFLHWLIAVLVLSNLALGISLESRAVEALPTMTQFALFQWHKTIGIMVLLASVLRIMWRLTHRPPPLPDTIPIWEKRVAGMAHFMLYALMLLLPLTGWLMVSASTLGIPTLLFGVVPWPHVPMPEFITDRGALANNLAAVHGWVAAIMATLIAAHVAAALRHHFWLHDRVLHRMIPATKKNTPDR